MRDVVFHIFSDTQILTVMTAAVSCGKLVLHLGDDADGNDKITAAADEHVGRNVVDQSAIDQCLTSTANRLRQHGEVNTLQDGMYSVSLISHDWLAADQVNRHGRNEFVTAAGISAVPQSGPRMLRSIVSKRMLRRWHEECLFIKQPESVVRRANCCED